MNKKRNRILLNKLSKKVNILESYISKTKKVLNKHVKRRASRKAHL